MNKLLITSVLLLIVCTSCIDTTSKATEQTKKRQENPFYQLPNSIIFHYGWINRSGYGFDLNEVIIYHFVDGQLNITTEKGLIEIGAMEFVGTYRDTLQGLILSPYDVYNVNWNKKNKIGVLKINTDIGGITTTFDFDGDETYIDTRTNDLERIKLFQGFENISN